MKTKFSLSEPLAVFLGQMILKNDLSKHFNLICFIFGGWP